MRDNIGEKLAWASGFWEAEGCCHLQKTRGTLVLRIAQIDIEVLERFKMAVGVGKIYGPYEVPNPNGKPQYVFSIAKQADVRTVMMILWPWLGRVKREQFMSRSRAATAKAWQFDG